MKIFLDVGAHRGQTLSAVMNTGFDRIYCFEPSATHWPVLDSLKTKRTTIERFGLWNKTATATLFEPGRKGAGLWVKDVRANMKIEKEECKFVRASNWFVSHIARQDAVYMKLNCEGAECDIIDDLLDSGEFDKVTFMMVDFDVRKVGSLKHRQAEVMARLAPYPPPRVMLSKNVMSGVTHQDRIRNWLSLLPKDPR